MFCPVIGTIPRLLSATYAAGMTISSVATMKSARLARWADAVLESMLGAAVSSAGDRAVVLDESASPVAGRRFSRS